MATISNTPRPGYAWDATDNCWYPIGTGPHTHSDYITQSTAINPSIVDAKGDLIVGSAADTVIRKPVGTDGQLLYADSTATGGIKWDAAPASGSMTLLSTTTLSGASTTISSISQSYKNLFIVIYGVTHNTSDGAVTIAPNNDSSSAYAAGVNKNGASSLITSYLNADRIKPGMGYEHYRISTENSFTCEIYNYTAGSTIPKNFQVTGKFRNTGNTYEAACTGAGGLIGIGAITSLVFAVSGGQTFSAGTVLLYGVN